MNRLSLLKGTLAAACGLVFATGATAQNYPSQSIKLIVPYVAGSPVDVLARVMFQKVSQTIGQMFIIENRPGAGTTIGSKAVAIAPPDGYTLLLAGQSLAYMNIFYPKLDIDPVKSFTPIAKLAGWSHVMIVPPRFPASTVKEFVQYAKTNPGKVSFGFGLGTSPQILGEYFKVMENIDILSVPYRGGENARQDLLAGQIHMNFVPISNVLELAAAGQVKVIAITHRERNKLLPDSPTFVESGYPQLGFGPDAWTALAGPAGMPEAVVKKLNQHVNEALKAPDLLATFDKLGMEPLPGSADDMRIFLDGHIAKWPEILKTAKISGP